MPRLVVVTNGNYFAARILSELFRQRHADIVGMVLVSGDYRGLTGLQALRSAVRSACLPYVVAKCLHIALVVVANRPRRRLLVNDLSDSYGIPTIEVDTVKSPEFIERLRVWRPDLLVSVSCPQRLPDVSFAEPKYGGLNIHSSLLPGYAGLAPYYWVLSKGQRKTGITVHRLTSRFDEGNILGQREVVVRPRESALGLFARLADLGGPLLVEAVELAETGASGTPQGTVGQSYFSQPDWASYWMLRRHRHRIIAPSDLARLFRTTNTP